MIDAWRAEADGLRRRGLSEAAAIIESLADDLERWLYEHRMAALTLTDAAEETGLAYDTLQRKVSSGEIPNVGRRGSPRVRRADLFSDEALLAKLGGV